MDSNNETSLPSTSLLSSTPLLPFKLPPCRQYFSLPYDVMKYILKNPKSTNGLLKLYQTCKYFYIQRPIVIISGEISFPADGGIDYDRNPRKLTIKQNKAEFWFINDLFIMDNRFYKYDFSKIYRSSIKSLWILNIAMTLDEFKLLVSENLVERLLFSKCMIKDSSDKNVSIDAILQLLPNLKYLYFVNDNEKFTSETLKNLNSIKFQNKLQKIIIQLKNVSETFDPKLMLKFIQQNASPELCDVYLNCSGNDADETETNLKTAEREIFAEQNGTKAAKICYRAPAGLQYFVL